MGHKVIGVDLERIKVDRLNADRAPVIAEVAAAMRSSDLFLICVGTPSLPNGGIDLRYVRSV